MPLETEVTAGREALLDLAAALGIDRTLLTEDMSRLRGSSTVSPAVLRAIDEGQLDRWFSWLGNALQITCRPPDDADANPPTLTRASHHRSSLDPLLEDAEKYGRELDVTVEIDKKILTDDLAKVLGATGVASLKDPKIVLFFFGETLQSILAAADYRYFEKEFLSADGSEALHQRLLILVAGVRGQLRGPFLTVLGEDHLGEAAAFLASAPSFDGLSQAHELMRSECLWDDRPQLLTPDFFSLAAADPAGLKVCREELWRLGNQLTVPYLANWTVRLPATLPVPAGGQGPSSAAGAGAAQKKLVAKFEGDRSVRIEAEGTSTAALDLYDWAYHDSKTARTRLHIVRRVVASRLPPGEKSFQEFVANAADLRSECDLQLRMLMDENLADSIVQRERIEKLVRDYVDEFGGQNASLSKEVVDNTYKTVGLLAGVALAYLLKPEQGITVLVVGVTLYVAYILFILRFYLRSLEEEHGAKWDAFELESRELERRGILTSESKPRLLAVHDADQKLDRKFRTVRRIYRVLVSAAIAFLLCWLVFVGGCETGETVRRRALGEQASRLKRSGYLDVRASVEGWPAPAPLVDAQGKAVLPDLTAIRQGDRQFLMLAWVPCARIGKPEELVELRTLHGVAAEKRVELQILTEAACGREPGADRLRRWLHGQLPDLRISTL
jgi:hypothetical protein